MTDIRHVDFIPDKYGHELWLDAKRVDAWNGASDTMASRVLDIVMDVSLAPRAGRANGRIRDRPAAFRERALRFRIRTVPVRPMAPGALVFPQFPAIGVLAAFL